MSSVVEHSHQRYLKRPRSFGMFVCVDRQEIIAALDTEIARLQHARALIAQSVAHVQPNERPRPLSPSAKQRSSVMRFERVVQPQSERRKQKEKEAPVLVVRVPAKEAPKQRRFRTTPKQTIALTGDVPRDPVAVPRKSDRHIEREPEGKFGGITPAPASAFGEAISRGFASTTVRSAPGTPSL
jgi:hypothetical protein